MTLDTQGLATSSVNKGSLETGSNADLDEP